MSSESASTGSKMFKEPTEAHDKKAKRAAAIKAHAKELFNALVIQGYAKLSDKLSDTTKSEEELISLQKTYAHIRADMCVTFASQFEKSWKKRRGEFVAD